jgi:hypothetical protein
LESAVAKVRQKSYGDHFWAFIHEKPEWVAATAFGIGMVAGKLTNGASLKHIKALSPKFANPVSQLAQAALKYLPGQSPSLQPGAGKARKARSLAKAKTLGKAKGTKSS